ncbi:MgtC/SapB family protein [Romboutsia weinsteinii]|uniref:MgtC/SapB family protein n=1 Tax=Romboutsia weinsteinii TaxID=2020949 RepID=A0A371J472_9FIRM|nr:MgtC/SapB family protein [Romboutsia weinsteinii]RDY27582.1 MgtC/SapB family protein [Romboutsia weinsteinii]
MEALLELNEVSTFVKLLLATICGGLLGFERGIKKRPAGFRTYMLVCLSSTMVMITNQYIADLYGLADPIRMAAQVISGIGFLGAGTIIVTGRNKVKGLTTAAGLWASACIGLTIGVGYYFGALIGCFMIFVVMSLLHDVDNYILLFRTEYNLYIEFESIANVSSFIEYIKYHNIKILDMELIRPSESSEEVTIGMFTIKMNKKIPYSEVKNILSKSKGVCFVEEV